MGLPLSGLAQNIRQVQVEETKDGVEIHVMGAHLPRPVNVTSGRNLTCTLKWEAGLENPGKRIQLNSGQVSSVLYGYDEQPHTVRMQIQTSKFANPVIRQTESGWVVFIGNESDAPVARAKAPAAMKRSALLAELLASSSKVEIKNQTVLTPAAAKQTPLLSLPASNPLPVEKAHGLRTPEKVVSLDAAKTAAKATAASKPPVVTMSPLLAKWATLEKVEKSQVERPIAKPAAVWKMQPAVSGSTPIESPVVGNYRRVTVDCSNADLTQVLKGLALQSGANIVIGPAVEGKVTADLHDVSIEQALKYISYLTGVKYEINDGIYMFGVVSAPKPAGAGHGITVNRAVFVQSEQEGKIALLLTTQFSNTGLVMLTSEKSEAKSDNVPNGADSNTKINSLISSENVAWARHFILMTGPSEIVDQAVAMATALDHELMRGYDAEQQSEEMVAYDVKYADPRALREALISQVHGLRAVVGPNSVGDFGIYKENSTKNQSVDEVRQADLASSGPGSGGTNAASAAPTGAVGSVNTSTVDDGALEQPFSKEESQSVPMKLVLTGTHTQVAQAIQFCKVLDTPPKQVALELRVMELTKTDALNAGIDWSITSGGIVKMVNLNNSQTSPNNQASLNVSGGGFNGTVTASLDALAEKNKLVARPNLVAMDGRQSEVFIGDIIRYVESITQSQNGTTVTTGEVPVGVRLSVLPRIGADGNMTLDLRPRVSLLTSFTQVPGGGELPQTSSRFAQSTISLQSGQTIAIGGLIQDQDVKTVSGLPFLMNLPIIGNLFKSTTINKERTELVIFLTAKAITGPVGPEALPMFNDVRYKDAITHDKP
jgi:type II secretory pathway component GspD/PulD (secretin)